MKTTFCRIIIYLLFAALTLGSAEARPMRNIFSVTHIDYENIGTSTVYENAFVAELRQGLSFMLKGYHDHRSIWDNTIVTLGPVININKYHYMELSYGYGQDSDQRRADYFSVDFTREVPGYLLGIGVRHSVYPGYTYNTVSPSIKYYLTPKLALWGKYFLSNDSDENINNAYWIDCEYFITSKFAVRSGVTGGNRLYSPEYESFLVAKADVGFSSFLAQATYLFSERILVKYQFEQVSRQSEFTDIKNIFILDIRL